MAETLNLVDPHDKLSVKYRISRFPDGQQTVDILETETPVSTFHMLKTQNTPITIKSRLNSFKDLELIICANQALKNIGVKSVKLYIPYILGGRSDRKFQEGGVNYLKDVICPIINQQEFDEVKVLDPHSDVIEACLNNFVKEMPYKLYQQVFKDYIDGGFIGHPSTQDIENVKKNMRILSPDAGAFKKVYDIARFLGVNEEILTATKHRELTTGKITHTSVPLSVHDADKDIFIFDDICDGGRTFLEIAKAIEQTRSLSSAVHPDRHGKIYLIVTHGIFSSEEQLKELGELCDGIYCTNSYKSFPETSNIKQVNIF
jgi:ribose-phosphate pyrophosphokinase